MPRQHAAARQTGRLVRLSWRGKGQTQKSKSGVVNLEATASGSRATGGRYGKPGRRWVAVWMSPVVQLLASARSARATTDTSTTDPKRLERRTGSRLAVMSIEQLMDSPARLTLAGCVTGSTRRTSICHQLSLRAAVFRLFLAKGSQDSRQIALKIVSTAVITTTVKADNQKNGGVFRYYVAAARRPIPGFYLSLLFLLGLLESSLPLNFGRLVVVVAQECKRPNMTRRPTRRLSPLRHHHDSNGAC